MSLERVIGVRINSQKPETVKSRELVPPTKKYEESGIIVSPARKPTDVEFIKRLPRSGKKPDLQSEMEEQLEIK